MGLFGSKRRKKSVRAQIAKVRRALARKADKKTLEGLRKQLRGY